MYTDQPSGLIVEARHVRKTYDAGATEVNALNGVDLAVTARTPRGCRLHPFTTRCLGPATMIPPAGAVYLYWIPLGAGAHVVRVSGKLFEAVSAFVQRRARCDLYHSALEVIVPEGRFVIEQAPITDLHGDRRGVVAEGPVGTRWLGHFRHFRYEIRRWREGQIPDIHDAVASPVRLADDLSLARRILDLLPSIPTPVWGRDELDAGEMWNSNSVISWVLERSGADIVNVQPPQGSRAPGWDAGLVVAAREREGEEDRPENVRVPQAQAG